MQQQYILRRQQAAESFGLFFTCSTFGLFFTYSTSPHAAEDGQVDSEMGGVQMIWHVTFG